MSRGPDAATLLERRLLLAAEAAGHRLVLGETETIPWASATFTGARHRLTLTGAAGSELEAWLQALPEADLPVRGHLVADLAVLSTAEEADLLCAEVEVLTVEER
jgi:hypothetical protein